MCSMDSSGVCRTFDMFVSMKVVGFDVENVPFMPDRGHLLVVNRLLDIVTGITISVKLCTDYLSRNTVGKFKLKEMCIKPLRKHIANMEDSTGCDRYIYLVMNLLLVLVIYGKI